MNARSKWYLDHQRWLEAFVIINLGFLALDIWLAHTVNQFRNPAEYIPFYFSLAAPVVLLLGCFIRERTGHEAPWRDLGYLAFSLGDPLPKELAKARFWTERRARSHWQSRTRRCLAESTGFTAFEQGFRRRDADPKKLAETLAALERSEPFKRGSSASLYRVGTYIVADGSPCND